MRSSVVSATAAAILAAAATPSAAAVKKVPYVAVNVQVAEPYKPDAAFEAMRKAFAVAVAKKDTQALFALVGPSFVRMTGSELSDDFDFGRDALHNFKVVFGFREYSKDADGGVADGPYWDSLAAFAADDNFYTAASTLVCGRTTATIVDDNVFERTSERIGADDSVEWYFTVAPETTATATPDGTDSSVGRVGQVALPLLSVYPSAPAGQPDAPVTHLQVLLPSGRNGWIPLSAAYPLVIDRLCYALTPTGDWKIAAFDQAK